MKPPIALDERFWIFIGGKGAGAVGAGEGKAASLTMREWPGGVDMEDNGEGENWRCRCPKLVRVVNRSRSRTGLLNEFIADNGRAVLMWSEERAPRRLPSITLLQLASASHQLHGSLTFSRFFALASIMSALRLSGS
jgi:hypothetical protein